MGEATAVGWLLGFCMYGHVPDVQYRFADKSYSLLAGTTAIGLLLDQVKAAGRRRLDQIDHPLVLPTSAIDRMLFCFSTLAALVVCYPAATFMQVTGA